MLGIVLQYTNMVQHCFFSLSPTTPPPPPLFIPLHGISDNVKGENENINETLYF